MHSAIPKVLHPLAGRPLVAHVLDAARTLVAAGDDRRRRSRRAGRAAGTGRVRPALRRCRIRRAAPATPCASRSPMHRRKVWCWSPSATSRLCRRTALADLVSRRARRQARGTDRQCPRSRRASAASCATTHGAVRAIVEERDADVRSSARSARSTRACMAAPAALMKQWVGALTADNAQGEYYITDIVAHGARAGRARRRARRGGRARRARHQRPRAARRGRAHPAWQRRAEALMRDGRVDRRSRPASTSAAICDAAATCASTSAACSRRCDAWRRRLRSDPIVCCATCTVGARDVNRAVLAPGGSDGRRGVPHRSLCAYSVPGRTLDDEVHVGNFVEVKASRIGRGSKANHLAYIGDTTVGAWRQLRRRIHHCQLRRRAQAPDRDRRPREHRIELRAGGAGRGRAKARPSARAASSPRTRRRIC